MKAAALLLAVFALLPLAAFAQQGGDGESSNGDLARLKSAVEELRMQIQRESEHFTNEKLLALQEIERLRAQRDGYLISISSFREDISSLANDNNAARQEIKKSRAENERLNQMIYEAGVFVEPTALELRDLIDASIPGGETLALQSETRKLSQAIESGGTDAVKASEKLFDIAGRLLERSAQVERYRGKILSRSGSVVDASFIRIGELTSLFVTENGSEAGIMLRSALEEDSSHYEKLLPGGFAEKIREAFDKPPGEISSVPLDVSKEMVAGAGRGGEGAIAHLARGGPVMAPLLLLAALALVLILERLVSLRREGRSATRFAGEIVDTFREKGLQPALALAGGGRGAVARVLKAGLEKANAPVDIFEETLHEAALAEVPRLERFLSTIAVLATVAPLMGLLGTVTGMISAFETITAYGTSDPRLLSGGISEALITTEVGLIIAIPVLLIHGFLSAKVDRISADLEQASSRMLAAVTEGSKAQEKADD